MRRSVISQHATPERPSTREEGFTEAELNWAAKAQRLGAALYRPRQPRYVLKGGAEYVWQQVRDHITQRIEAGQLGPRLPKRQTLAHEYGVSVSTVNRAIHELAEQGPSHQLPSKGTAIANHSTVEFPANRSNNRLKGRVR